MKEKIILGTVQLGVSYGISNSTGRPSETEAFDILNYAFENGIKVLDSADGYGEALQVLGRYNAASSNYFEIINKFKADAEPLMVKFERSMKILGRNTLLCYMYHQFSDYASGIVKKDLAKLKAEGAIKKIGVSIYNASELAKVCEDGDIDVIQLPVNLFDLAAHKKELLERAKANGKEIHARSVYLQGLFFRDPASLTGNMTPLKPYLEQLKKASESSGVDLKKIAFNFVLANPCIDKVVLGIEQKQQLVDNLSIIDSAFDATPFDSIRVKSEDAWLLNPANWKI